MERDSMSPATPERARPETDGPDPAATGSARPEAGTAGQGTTGQGTRTAGDLGRRAVAGLVRGIGGARVVGPDGGPPHFPEQAVYYANHSSHLDFVTLWAVMPPHLRRRVRPVAAQDYWGAGWRRRIAEGLFNAHLVRRQGHDAGASRSPQRTGAGAGTGGQLAGMTAVLDAGDSLIIFPEGTRGDAETVAAFHSGLYRLARHDPRIPVVPVTLRDLGRILPKGEVVPVPHLSTVVVHDPLPSAVGCGQGEYLAAARAVLVESLGGGR